MKKPASAPGSEAVSSPEARPPRAWATLTLVGLNVLVFGAMVVSGISAFNPDAQQVLRWGADFGPLTLHGEWWRLGTSMFLHFGLLHLAFNMWALLNLGLLAEALLGPRAFLALYLLSGVGGSLASVLAHPLAVGGGASGAIFGVAGGLIASLLLKRRGSGSLHAIRRQLPSLAMFVLYNLIFGFGTSGIDNVAHVGGLAVGAGFCSALALLPTGERTFSLALLSAGFALALGFAADAVRRVRAPATAAFQQQEPHMRPPATFQQQEPHMRPPLDIGAEVARLERLVTRTPDSIELYTALGTAYMEAMRPNDAVGILERARSRRPDDVGVLTALGTAYLNLRRFNDAIASFGRAAQVDSSNPDARYNLADAYLLRGAAFADSGTSDQARADFERVLRLVPDTALVRQARDQLRSLQAHRTR